MHSKATVLTMQVEGGLPGVLLGDDPYTGGDGDDSISGTTADEHISGGGGNDTLYSGGGADTLDGGDGDDDLTFGQPAGGTALAYGGTGNDHFYVEGIAASVDGGDGTDSISGDLRYAALESVEVLVEDGVVTLDQLKAFEQVTSSRPFVYLGFVGPGGTVKLGAIVDPGLSVTMLHNDLTSVINLTGTSFNDFLRDSAFADTLHGGGGNDTLTSSGGLDALAGGEGDDLYILLAPGARAIEVPGGGSDTIRAVDFDVALADFPHIENLDLEGNTITQGTGTNAANRINGSYGSNLLLGRGGDDTIYGGPGGNDTIAGGEGADLLYGESDDPHLASQTDDDIEGGAGADTMSGGDGNDSFVYRSAEDIEAGEVIDGGGWTDAIRVAGNGPMDFRNVTITGVEQLHYSPGRGSAIFDSSQFGTGKIAAIEGSAATDRLVIFASSTVVTLANVTASNWQDGRDTIALVGTSQADRLTGNDNANRVSGGIGADLLFGRGGNDVLVGGKGNDTMNGGAGADVFAFNTSRTGADTINGFQVADDRFDLSGGLFSAASESAGNTILKHSGGLITVTGVTGLSLSDWNDLVQSQPSARAGTAANDADFSFSPATATDPAAGLPADRLFLVHADFSFA